jgi:long-chain acyl-CoA synthetase
VNGNFLKICRSQEGITQNLGEIWAPQPIASSKSDFIEQMMVIGDNKKFVSALIVPSFPR